MNRQEAIAHLRNEVPYFIHMIYPAYQGMCGCIFKTEKELIEKLSKCLDQFEESRDQNRFIICNSTDGPELLIEIYYGPDRGVGVTPGSWIGSLGLIYQSYKHTPLGGQGDKEEKVATEPYQDGLVVPISNEKKELLKAVEEVHPGDPEELLDTCLGEKTDVSRTD